MLPYLLQKEISFTSSRSVSEPDLGTAVISFVNSLYVIVPLVHRAAIKVARASRFAASQSDFSMVCGLINEHHTLKAEMVR